MQALAVARYGVQVSRRQGYMLPPRRHLYAPTPAPVDMRGRRGAGHGSASAAMVSLYRVASQVVMLQSGSGHFLRQKWA